MTASAEPAARRDPTAATRPPAGGRLGWVPEAFATFFGALGLLCALLALIEPLRRLFRPVAEALEVLLVPISANLAYAVFLFLLAGATAARKKAAWWLVVVYLGLLVLTDALAVGVGMYTEALLPLVVSVLLLALLVVARREFYAASRRAAVRRALGVLAAGLIVAILLGWGLVLLFPGTLPASQHLAWAADRVCGGLISEGSFSGRPPRKVSFVLGLLGALALLNAAATLFRSQRLEAALHDDEEARIRALLAAYGERDSLGYFATRRDKAVVFSPSGKAAVTYRVEAGVCLASGDPVGDMEAWPHAIACWLDLARRYAWAPAVMGASEDGARAYARAGLGALQLGDEAIVPVASFDLDGRDMRVTRQAVHRVARTGATCRIRRHSSLGEREMEEVVDKADAWRDTETERGFSMALDRLGDPADGDCLLVEALGEDGRLLALLSFVPWGRSGISLDLMRRDRAAPNGVMEFMVAELCTAAPKLGLRRISLNFAVFRSVFEEGARIGAGPVLRLWRRLLLFFSRWWQLEALYRSNAKYHPEWYPRFICYGETASLARIGLASGIAEGFVSVPSLRKLWGKGHAKNGPRPATTQGLPPLTAPGPGEGDRAAAAAPQAGLPDQVRVRRRTLDRLRAAGTDPYPVGGPAPTHALADVRPGQDVTVAGRVMLVRDFGGIVFAVLRDWSGDHQIALTRDTPGAALDRFAADIDIGDHITVTGHTGRSDKGEPTVFVTSWQLTGKCLRPLPDKRRGLADPEAKVRRRYLDLATSPAARAVIRARCTAVQALRQGLLDRGYVEVETPMLQQIHGGANARPFTTHINAYDLDLYLRIAPELYLKRLCVGGLEKVFELGRTFRNEGVSYKHNPEFTMLEAYQAHADYTVMLDLTRELIQGAASAVFGSPVARKDGQEYDISGTWPVRTVYGAISEVLGEEITPGTELLRLHRLCDRTGVPYTADDTPGDVVLEMYERLVEERTRLPTFYKDFPAGVSPLTRQHRTDPRLAERWDLVAFGTELGTAYSELTDPVEQRRRLTEQSLRAAGGDPEAMELDEDFLQALEYAMPPTGGLGLGVDRLVMFLTGLTIRETLPFPLVRRR
ncbi:bifunctional lysylphosphatidylglycerol synthetase/lysine--tRNA ligase LysX [Streptomyces sp. FXJ1.172]|uniref:bifunctional lysylphosphatidylglycerol synthetase/lysine--tRNA ligase LysX n=1 Tax=Streptomyces sp. FXJ1.172 TaxID=710705 RepID=UPI0007CFC135|nr:bifunctional lysylphosphatidylglycerol synthetase/lysine--tRNA ligase LysX [Streptomyces sp. FXJ1.172]WEO93946.1 bifunctional lysylphosphatidylglycerol synthetase/lysine--tRNA ligase LysX [Streptomyces sp. FXJ1.172]